MRQGKNPLFSEFIFDRQNKWLKKNLHEKIMIIWGNRLLRKLTTAREVRETQSAEPECTRSTKQFSVVVSFRRSLLKKKAHHLKDGLYNKD